MRRRILTATAAILCSAPACSLFSVDGGPAADAIAQLRAISAQRAEKEAAIVAKITDPEIKGRWSESFQRDHSATVQLLDSLLAWVGEVGSVDWRDLYEMARGPR